jgi:hypothetical protein
MHLAPASAVDWIASSATPALLDRRRHKRAAIALLGRFMRASKEEYPCKLINISAGGAAMMSPVGVDLGEHVVAYFDHISGIEGPVVRSFDGGFAMAITASQHKREKLAAQLTWLLNRHELPAGRERRHDRSTPHSDCASLKLDDDVVMQASLRNVSVSGASLTTEARPPIGSTAVLGRLRCRVVRHHEEGIAVEFIDVQQPDALRRSFS